MELNTGKPKSNGKIITNADIYPPVFLVVNQILLMKYSYGIKNG